MGERQVWVRLAALSGFLSVAAGAFAAHNLTDPLAKEWMRTGANYEGMHALAALLAVLLLPQPPRARLPAALFLSGSVVFSGTLYAMALGAPHWLGAITPLGGLSLLGGWATLAWMARSAG